MAKEEAKEVPSAFSEVTLPGGQSGAAPPAVSGVTLPGGESGGKPAAAVTGAPCHLRGDPSRG
eukprot:8961773-Pyramimonas_sp.AAC.1